MGVVYSSAELAVGAIPNDDAHVIAANMVLDKLSDVDEVMTTLVHGSVADGTHNRRSDLDVLIVYKYSGGAASYVVDEVNRHLDEIGEKTSVKIEANIWPHNEPRRAREQRMYDLLFNWHLVRAMESSEFLIGEVDELTVEVADTEHDTERIRDIALNYTVYKQGGFTNAPRRYNDSDKSVLTAMQRGMELPKAIGRKVAQLVGASEGRRVQVNEFEFDIELLDPETRTVLDRLTRLNIEYTEILESYVNSGVILGDRDIEAYKSYLDHTYRIVVASGLVACLGLTDFINDYSA